MLDSTCPCPQPVSTELPDHARARDLRDVPIDQVGIRGLRVPIHVGDDAGSMHPTVADVSMSVSLPPDVRGTHMSRLVEILETRRDFLTPSGVLAMLAEMCDRLGARDARVEMGFPWFVIKRAPVSGARSSMEYRCALRAERRDGQSRIVRLVDVPVTSLCPCSKAVSDRGAHNQRSLVQVEIEGAESTSFDGIITAVEGCASAPLYTLLKRQDEKLVTEQAYDNPRFVEDLVRDVLLALRALPEVERVKVSVDNFESIHNHAAFAELAWSAEESPEPASPRRTPTSEPFGSWLRRCRAERGLSQVAMAGHLGLSPSFLSKVERGASNLSSESLEAVAAVLGEPTAVVMLRAGLVPERLLEAMRSRPEELLAWADR
jgi:GTP cyclohydrolase IB